MKESFVFMGIKLIISKAKVTLYRLVMSFRVEKMYRKYGLSKNDYTDTFSAKDNNYIWTIWWEGIDSAPKLVQNCINRMVHLHPDKKVIVITAKNYKDYCDIPDNIINKVEKGKIILSVFADIIKFNVLKNHGGVYCDSTVYIYTKLPDYLWNKPVFSPKDRSGIARRYIPKGKWTGNFLSGQAGHGFFCYGNDFLEAYWNNNDKLLEYFLLDDIIKVAYKYNIAEFKNIIDTNNIFWDDYNLISPKLSEVWSDEIEHTLVGNETPAYKLSYKREDLDLLETNKDCIYFHLMYNMT